MGERASGRAATDVLVLMFLCVCVWWVRGRRGKVKEERRESKAWDMKRCCETLIRKERTGLRQTQEGRRKDKRVVIMI